MTAMTADLTATILAALRLRETEAAACLIRHLSRTDPEAAQTIRDAIEHTEARLRAERGALEMRDWAEYVAEQNANYWEGSE